MEDLAKPTDGIVSRYLNRRISTRISLFLVRRNIDITPNQVSVLSFLIGILASLLYLLGEPLAGGIMVQIGSVVDGVDGEIARLRGMGSRRGAFLDSLLDRLFDVMVISAIGIYHHAILGLRIPDLLALIGALSGSLLVSYVHARSEASLGIHAARIGRLRGFASRDVRLFLIFLFSILGKPMLSLYLIAFISYLYSLGKLLEILNEFEG